jgi:MFS family permease
VLNGQTVPAVKKSRYGYVIVLSSFAIQAIGLSIVTGYSLFFNPMLADLGWTRAAISLGATVNTISFGATAILTGWVADRFGPRPVMTIHSLLFGTGLVLMSRVTQPWQLYLTYGVLCGAGLSAINIVLMSTIARWFTKTRSLMTGIVKVGAGIGIFAIPFVITPLIQYSRIIQNSGWRSAAFILGISSAVLMVIAAQFLRRAPSPEKLQIEEGRDMIKTGNNSVDFTFREAIRTRQFWMLALSFFTLNYCFQAVQTHIVPHAQDIGATAASAAMIISILGMSSIAGRLGIGFIGDRWGTKFALILCCITVIIGLAWLQIASTITMLFAFGSIHGLFHGGFGSITSPATAKLFGTRSIGVIFGATQFLALLLGSLGGVISGLLYDKFGNYTLAFAVCLGLAAIGLVLISLIRPPNKDAQIISATLKLSEDRTAGI